jgi:tetratricopeptide (TPR) repeat protein
VRLALLLAVLAAGAVAAPYLGAWYHLRAGRAALERYHSAEARRHLDAYLRVWPDSAEGHLLAARAARREDDFPAAEQHVLAAQRLAGTSDETVFEWALYHAAAGHLEDVEGYLRARSRKDPSQAPLVLEALAEGYTRVYRIVDALACLDAWLAHRPDDVQALVLRGNVWKQVQVWGKAVPDYRRALELDPERQDLHAALGMVLQEAGRNEEALPHLEAARQHRPGDPDVLVRLARCHQGLGELAKARECLDAVLAGHPDNPPALRTRGQQALLEGRPEEAEDWLRRAVRAAPRDYRAHFALGNCLKERHKDAEARAEQAAAEKLKERLERLGEITHRQMSATPRDPALHLELGNLLIELGYPEVGCRWLESALKLDLTSRAAHAALARCYEEQGDAERAAYHRRQAEAPQAAR